MMHGLECKDCKYRKAFNGGGDSVTWWYVCTKTKQSTPDNGTHKNCPLSLGEAISQMNPKQFEPIGGER